MQANYHTHTYRCRHAGQWGDEEYVQAALASGYRVLGFSDHTPWPYRSGFLNPGVRMPLPELPEYLASIRLDLERQLENIYLVDPDGTERKLRRKDEPKDET